jgi:hypothetical protein
LLMTEKFLENTHDTLLERDINQAIGRLEMCDESAIEVLKEFISNEQEFISNES